MSGTHYLEIETKYKSDEIKLADFQKLMVSQNPVSVLEVSSFDHYFAATDPNVFLRHRTGNKPQLTLKRKLITTNNWVRVECNVDLGEKATTGSVARMCKELGFDHNFTIFKTCFIYYWENHNVVYYVVYDEEMKEKARFIEVEMSEDKAWVDEAEAWTALSLVEKSLESLGINAQRRTRRSLFEMFRKTNDERTTTPITG